jgi:predicted metal-dependent enzyme (double-stranded beta helix superfamily)
MTYTLEQFSQDCRAALKKDPGPAGREEVRKCVEKACADPNFVAKYFGPDNDTERKILYEDPELRFCILAHVYKGARGSNPHDHGPSWAVYGQAKGVTELTDWRCLERPAEGKPGKVAKVRSYDLKPGTAHVYNEGDLHSPRRESDTCLIRIEGQNLDKVKRQKYEVAA